MEIILTLEKSGKFVLEMSKKIAVIGSGIGGLASALRLSTHGYDVTVYESSGDVGGKISEIKSNGYRFDKGPSLFTLPNLVDELIEIGTDKKKKSFEYLKLDIACRYFFDDKTIINAYCDNKKFIDEASIKTKTDPLVIEKYLNYSSFLYNSTHKLFIEKSLHKLSTYLSIDTFFAFLKIPFLSLFTTMNETNKRRLKNKKLINIFNRFATYNGSDPFVAPGILNVISHLEMSKGVYLPKRGMRSIVESIYKLCLNNQVKFKINSKVDKISVLNGSANGIYVDDKFIPYDIILSNIDIHYVYTNLLGYNFKFLNKLSTKKSTSAIIFYWGIKKNFKNLDLHNIFFSSNYQKEFSQIKEGNNIQNDPTIYVNITSKFIHSDAPEGCENWFVMINVSHNKGQDWSQLVANAREIIINKLNKALDSNIEKVIEYENYMSPVEIEKFTGSHMGSLYGSSSNKKMDAFFRHPNFTNKIDNLYFCGGTVHPGGGIPLVLNSAKIATKTIIENDL